MWHDKNAKHKDKYLPLPFSDVPQLLSTKTRNKKSPSSPLSKVQGMMQYLPGGNKILLLTSLKLMKVSTRSIWKTIESYISGLYLFQDYKIRIRKGIISIKEFTHTDTWVLKNLTSRCLSDKSHLKTLNPIACSDFLSFDFWATEITTGQWVISSYISGSLRLIKNWGFIAKDAETQKTHKISNLIWQ